MCPKCSFDNTDAAVNCVQCATPLRHLLGKNAVLSQRYKVVQVLGCGAMGAVYLAEDQRLVGRRCAIKENRPDPHAPANVQEQSREQFLAEARILARLDHPNLPKVSDYFIGPRRAYEYLVMDYVEGEDLESRMARTKRPFDAKDVAGWADQVLDALAYLHNQRPQPIIHRDIKPANLRVDLYNRIKLVDFGLVKLFDPDSPETKAELRGVGTPAYAPLEQFAGSEEHTDKRSDIYSLGATLYHLLTTTPPVEVHKRLLKPESLINIRELNPQVPVELVQVVEHAMNIYPDDRYQSAEEMRHALAVATGKIAPGAAPAKSSGSKLSPLWFGLIGLLLVLLILAGIAIAVFRWPFAPAAQPPATAQAVQPAATTVTVPTPTPQPPTPSRTPTATATQVVQPTPTPARPVTATPTPQPTDTPLPSPSPQPQAVQPPGIPARSLVGTIAYPVFTGARYDLYFGQADGSGTRLWRTEASQPAFSPDGSQIAFHAWDSANRGLVATDLGGKSGALVANFVEDQLPTWTADGSQIVFLTRRSGSRQSELYTVSSSAERTPGTRIGDGEYPTIGLNGRLVFKGWGSAGLGLRIASADYKDIRPVTDNEQDTAPALSPDGSQIAFMSRRSGNWEIYVVNSDGSNLQRITDDPAEDGLPAWSPDGRVIAFASNRGGAWAVWAATPDGSAVQQLFQMQGPPDGFVEDDIYASRGWAEERISWTK